MTDLKAAGRGRACQVFLSAPSQTTAVEMPRRGPTLDRVRPGTTSGSQLRSLCSSIVLSSLGRNRPRASCDGSRRNEQDRLHADRPPGMLAFLLFAGGPLHSTFNHFRAKSFRCSPNPCRDGLSTGIVAASAQLILYAVLGGRAGVSGHLPALGALSSPTAPSNRWCLSAAQSRVPASLETLRSPGESLFNDGVGLSLSCSPLLEASHTADCSSSQIFVSACVTAGAGNRGRFATWLTPRYRMLAARESYPHRGTCLDASRSRWALRVGRRSLGLSEPLEGLPRPAGGKTCTHARHVSASRDKTSTSLGVWPTTSL